MVALPEVIAITETKLNNKNKHLTTLDHYEFIHVDSQSQAGESRFLYEKRPEVQHRKAAKFRSA